MVERWEFWSRVQFCRWHFLIFLLLFFFNHSCFGLFASLYELLSVGFTGRWFFFLISVAADLNFPSFLVWLTPLILALAERLRRKSFSTCGKTRCLSWKNKYAEPCFLKMGLLVLLLCFDYVCLLSPGWLDFTTECWASACQRQLWSSKP